MRALSNNNACASPPQPEAHIFHQSPASIRGELSLPLLGLTNVSWKGQFNWRLAEAMAEMCCRLGCGPAQDGWFQAGLSYL